MRLAMADSRPVLARAWPGGQAADDVEVAAHADEILRVQAKGLPQLRSRFGEFRVRIAKFCGMTPTMVCGAPSSTIDWPTTVGIASEPPLPQTVTEHHFRLDPVQIAVGRERATDERWRAEHGKKIRGRVVRENLDRFAAAGHGRATVMPSCHVGERAALATPLVEIARGDTCTGRQAQHDDPLRLREAQRAEQDRIDDGEHRGAGADAERQRGDGRDGKAGARRRRRSV